MALDEESSLLTTFQTPFGRYKWNRLPFGLSVSSEIFQRHLFEAIEGLPGVYSSHDDIIVVGCGTTDDEATTDHNKNLKALLERCREKNIALNGDKLEPCRKEIGFTGHIITNKGLQADPEKNNAIIDMTPPTDVKGIQRFCGFVNYLAKFLPHLSEVMEPIRQLTKSNVSWHWGDAQDKAFNDIKTLVTQAPVLAYFNPEAEVSIQCDASDKGLGSALLQNEKPIAYASRALTEAEKRYCPLEKEMLAVVFSLEKFHQYVYAKDVTIFSDHKPLEAILQKPLSSAPSKTSRHDPKNSKVQYQNYS